MSYGQTRSPVRSLIVALFVAIGAHPCTTVLGQDGHPLEFPPLPGNAEFSDPSLLHPQEVIDPSVEQIPGPDDPGFDDPGLTGPGFIPDPEPLFPRPKFQLLRHQEDWSVMRGVDRSQLQDYWDPIKFIPLNDDESVWVSFGGQVRLRVENWNGFGFNDDDGTFLLTRFLFHADTHFGDNIRIYAEGKSALSTERDLAGGRRGLDADELDLQQLFGDFVFPMGDSTLTFRPGRQMLLFGKQRLVSPLGWSNTLRTWDGLSAILKVNGWTVTGFWAQFVPVTKFDLNDTDAQNELAGVYATGPLSDSGAHMDLYWLELDRDFTPGGGFNGTSGREDRHTLGGRIWGKIADSGIDYDIEGAYQTGKVGSGAIEAWMASSELGLTLGDTPEAPRVHVGLDYASGDKDPGGRVGTFNHLFPLGHAYLGYVDAVGRQNIIDISPGISFKPLDKLTVKIAGHFFWLASVNDSLYNAGGGARTRTSGSSKDVGQEVDLLVSYGLDHHTTAKVGYSHFFPGDYLGESGNGNKNHIDFVYFVLQYTF